jgi:dGTPase
MARDIRLNKAAELHAWEDRLLAPYALRAAATAGRRHPEPPHPFRTAFQRDRARIVHSRAFRRLEYKTQVFLNGTGDHLRTRLTHTIEVAQVSRTIARSLALNEDLAEGVALAHDLGHSPFGHAGEEVLRELMAGHGGFEHNLQSLRVVEWIEVKYPEFDGLNLSLEVLEGLDKHGGKRGDGATARQLSLEAQVANLSDEIAYYSHDIEDGLLHGLLSRDALSELAAWKEIAETVGADEAAAGGRDLSGYIVRCLIDRQVEDVILASHRALSEADVTSPDGAREHPEPLIRYSEGRAAMNRELRAFLYENLYLSPAVAEVNRAARALLRGYFEAVFGSPSLLGGQAARRIERDGLHRTVCDYVAGMTDRYIIDECRRLGIGGDLPTYRIGG